jgi:Lar family restriction alleviation protein
LKDGRLLITDEAYQRLHAGYIASKRLTVSGTDAPTDHINPCPFCKGVGRVESVPVPTSEFNERNYFVRCGSCAAEGPWQYSETGAIRFWNMRTPA